MSESTVYEVAVAMAMSKSRRLYLLDDHGITVDPAASYLHLLYISVSHQSRHGTYLKSNQGCARVLFCKCACECLLDVYISRHTCEID